MLLRFQTTASSIDPIALLEAHQQARLRDARLVSVVCGPIGFARSIWGQWIAQHEGEPNSSTRCVVSPAPDMKAARNALTFAAAGSRAALLFIPTADDFASALASAHTLATDEPHRPIAIACHPDSVMSSLQMELSAKPLGEQLRRALIGGLVVLERQAEEKLNKSALREDERPLYRSKYEEVLHTFLVHDAGVPEVFKPNHMVRGGSQKRYAVDLWCAELKLALEVDGGQHVSSVKQKSKDSKRDADLASAGIATIRILAAEIMSDPTSVLNYIRQRIEARREEVAT